MTTHELIISAKKLLEVWESWGAKDQAVVVIRAYALLAIAQELKRMNDSKDWLVPRWEEKNKQL